MNTVEKLNYVSERYGAFDNGIGIDPDGNELRDHNTGEAIFVDPIITKNDNTINSFLFYDLFSASKHNRTSSNPDDRENDSEAIGHLKYGVFANYGVPLSIIPDPSHPLFPPNAIEDFYSVMTMPDSNGDFDTNCLSKISNNFSYGNGVPISQLIALELAILATQLPNPDAAAAHNSKLLLENMDEINTDKSPAYTPTDSLISILESHNLIDKFEAFLDNPDELTKNIFAEQYVASRNITPQD